MERHVDQVEASTVNCEAIEAWPYHVVSGARNDRERTSALIGLARANETFRANWHDPGQRREERVRIIGMYQSNPRALGALAILDYMELTEQQGQQTGLAKLPTYVRKQYLKVFHPMVRYAVRENMIER